MSMAAGDAAASRTGVATTVMGSRVPPRRAEITMRVITGCGQVSTCRRGNTGAGLTAVAGLGDSDERTVASVASIATSITALAAPMAVSKVRIGADKQCKPNPRDAGRSVGAPL